MGGNGREKQNFMHILAERGRKNISSGIGDSTVIKVDVVQYMLLKPREHSSLVLLGLVVEARQMGL